jgi:DNA processing protein
VLAEQKEFPKALRHIPYPPFGIYLRGGGRSSAVLSAAQDGAPTIAIVGTRRASAEGKKIARSFACELAAAGCTIASGLAFGIDAAAHEGALDAGGATVVVLAGGLDVIYPHSHRGLAERILASGGTLISEYPPGEPPLAYRFIERNRIMSGISRGVLIVEAPESSGALATARYAAEQNRDVFVVPGAVSATNFKGSHALIRQGAELVTSPDDILDEYGIDKKENARAPVGASSPEEIVILKALAEIGAPADVDKLIALTKLEPRTVNQTLSFLLIRGIVKETEGGYTI